MLGLCLVVERHPDNITATLEGRFIGACLSRLNAGDMGRTEIALSEVLPELAGGEDTERIPPIPPRGIGQFGKFRFAPEIKAIGVIPDFKVDTANARQVPLTSYSGLEAVCHLRNVDIVQPNLYNRSLTHSVSRS